MGFELLMFGSLELCCPTSLQQSAQSAALDKTQQEQKKMKLTKICVWE
jgi:hypothetical protein